MEQTSGGLTWSVLFLHDKLSFLRQMKAPKSKAPYNVGTDYFLLCVETESKVTFHKNQIDFHLIKQLAVISFYCLNILYL